MSTTKLNAKPVSRRERRQDEAMRLVNRLTETREATIAKLVKVETRLIEARRALARSDKAVAKEKAELRAAKKKKPAAIEPDGFDIPKGPPLGDKTPEQADALIAAARMRESLRNERKRK